MRPDEIATPTGRVWLGEDGIIRSVALPGSEETLPTARINMAAIAEVSAGIKRPVLVDLTRTTSISRDARAFYTGEEAARHYVAVGLLVGSPLSRVIGNFYVGLNRLAAPTRLFTSEDSALEWLKEYLP